ncbi:MAG: hypothetical protein AAFP92_18425 [Bacteroidota bacterium]
MTIYEKAIEKWGRDVQTQKIQEECLELALAINQYQCPTKDPVEAMNHIYDELADVSIMIKYIPYLFDKDEVEKRISQKLMRLGQLIGVGGDKPSLDLSDDPTPPAERELEKKIFNALEGIMPNKEWHKRTGFSALKISRIIVEKIQEP